MIASFDREEEQDFEELVLFLKEKGYRDCTGMASAAVFLHIWIENDGYAVTGQSQK